MNDDSRLRLDDRDHPLARLRRVTLDALSDAEVLALLLGEAPTRARELLRAHDGLRGVVRAGRGALSQDIGERRATRVAAALEVARRVMSTPLALATPYRSSRDVVRAYAPRLVDLSEETVVAVLLDARQRPLLERTLGFGGVSACALGPRQVFALAVREGATGVIVVHNHPSGDPTPSSEDVEFTRRLEAAGRLLDVMLLDHVVVGREGSFSFLDAGLISQTSGAA